MYGSYRAYGPSHGYGQVLARKKFSKLFTIELIDNWLKDYGDSPVTSEDLLNNGNCGYYFMRAAGVSNPSYGRSREEIRRMNAWYAFFEKNPLPTRDGRNDATLEYVGEKDGLPAFRVIARPRAFIDSYSPPQLLAPPV